MAKKFLAELVGTMVLVLMGCGVAVSLSCGVDTASVVGTAMAFGLSVVAMAYTIGGISGCHINPAVSLGVLISGGMTAADFVGYVISQCLGAFAGAGMLKLIFDLGNIEDKTGGLGSNGLAGVNGSAGAGLLVEILLTCIFVMTILGVTSKKAKHGSFGGLIIGLTLTLVHIFGIGLTGTSVNPARSIGPAILAGGSAVSDLWVFIVGPFIGAAIAAFVYKWMEESIEAEKPVVAKAPAVSKPNASKPASKQNKSKKK